MGCMQRDSKRAMVRIAGRSNGEIEADFSARLPGRGGYLHPRAGCLERFVNSKVKVFRSLRRGIDRRERLSIVKLIEMRLDSRAALE